LAQQPDAPRLHGLCDIFEVLQPHIITDNLNLAPNLPVGVVGHAHTARFCDGFKTSRNVDAIAEDIIVIEDNVSDVNTDTKLYPLVRRGSRVSFVHTALDFNSTADGIHSARKLD